MAKDAAGLGQALGAIAADMTAALDAYDAASYLELDKHFHQCIIDRCGNHYLSRSYAVIAFRIQALRYRLAMDPALNADSLAQHHALARLIGEATAKGRGPVAKAHRQDRRRLSEHPQSRPPPPAVLTVGR